MKELIWVRVQYASRHQCCKTHKRPLPFYLLLKTKDSYTDQARSTHREMRNEILMHFLQRKAKGSHGSSNHLEGTILRTIEDSVVSRPYSDRGMNCNTEKSWFDFRKDKQFFSSTKDPYRLRRPPLLLFSDCWSYFARGKAAEA